MAYKNSTKRDYLVALIFLTILTIPLSVANTVLSKTGAWLFMDERITFDGVRKILHPASISSLIYELLDGGDQRYGRILWNMAAVTSFLPEKLFGEKGQIVATRFMLIALLISTLIIWKKFFVSPVIWILFSICIFALNGTAYFASMPKPEMIGMFLISAALCQFLRKEEDAKDENIFLYSSLFLGLAGGAKVIFLAPTLMLLTAIYLKFDKIVARNLRIYFAMYVIGFSISVPILSSIALLIIIIVLRTEDYIKIMKRGLILFFFVVVLLMATLTTLFSKTIPIAHFKRWLQWTILNTSHGADSNTVTPLNWIVSINKNYYPIIYGLIIASFATIVTKKYRTFAKKKISLYLIVSFLVLLFVPIILIKRIWLIYFYPTAFFVCLFTYLLLDNLSQSARLKVLIISIAAVITTNLYFISNEIQFISDLGSREKTNSHIRQLQDYEIYSKYLEKASSPNSVIAMDPTLYVPIDAYKKGIELFWGEFQDWKRYQILIFGPGQLELGINSNEHFNSASVICSNDCFQVEYQSSSILIARKYEE